MYANSIQAEGAKYIAQGIQESKIKDLEIDLYFNNVTEVGTKDICDSILTVHGL